MWKSGEGMERDGEVGVPIGARYTTPLFYRYRLRTIYNYLIYTYTYPHPPPRFAQLYYIISAAAPAAAVLLPLASTAWGALDFLVVSLALASNGHKKRVPPNTWPPLTFDNYSAMWS